MHRHSNVGRKFSRERGPRKALFRGLSTSVILYEKVKTTLPKAKEIQPIVEKLITKAKKGDLAAIRDLNAWLLNGKAVEKLVKEIAPLYKTRNGGYTRITLAGYRAGDNAKMAIIELLDVEKLVREDKPKKEAAKKAEPKAETTEKPAAKTAPKKKAAATAEKGKK